MELESLLEPQLFVTLAAVGLYGQELLKKTL